MPSQADLLRQSVTTAHTTGRAAAPLLPVAPRVALLQRMGAALNARPGPVAQRRAAFASSVGYAPPAVNEVGPPVQRVGYQRAGGQADEVVEIEVGEHQVTATGHIRQDDELSVVEGSVSLSPDEVVRWQVMPGGNPMQNIPALRVFGLDARPRGQRIGQLLALHHALEAQARGITIITARSVSGAGGPFYLPLGFSEFLGAPRWQDLTDQRRELVQALQVLGQGPAIAPNPAGEDVGEVLAQRYVDIINALANVAMFIPTDTLIANATAAIAGRWNPTIA